jgi:hypothetical protein
VRVEQEKKKKRKKKKGERRRNAIKQKGESERGLEKPIMTFLFSPIKDVKF